MKPPPNTTTPIKSISPWLRRDDESQPAATSQPVRSREDDIDDDLDGRRASAVGFSRTRVQALGRAVAGSSDDVSVSKPSGRKKAVSLAELKRRITLADVSRSRERAARPSPEAERLRALRASARSRGRGPRRRRDGERRTNEEPFRRPPGRDPGGGRGRRSKPRQHLRRGASVGAASRGDGGRPARAPRARARRRLRRRADARYEEEEGRRRKRTSLSNSRLRGRLFGAKRRYGRVAARLFALAVGARARSGRVVARGSAEETTTRDVRRRDVSADVGTRSRFPPEKYRARRSARRRRRRRRRRRWRRRNQPRRARAGTRGARR